MTSPAIDSVLTWLADPDDAILRHASQSGALATIIPEWARLTGPVNVQHSTHHFLLDDHTLKVVECTKRSPYYQQLSPYYQRLTALAALLHDIEKNTGPHRLKGLIPVDKLHPIKSAETAREILSRLQVSPIDVSRIYTLIHHHQVFGRLFILYPEGAPDDSLLKIALKLRSVDLTTCLLALSEGDIRSVQDKDAFFSARVAAKLAAYGDRVREIIHGFSMPETPIKAWMKVPLEETWPWGGISVAYGEADSPECVPVTFLPEHVAYYGPAFSLPQDATMALFYDCLTRNFMPPAGVHGQEVMVIGTRPLSLHLVLPPEWTLFSI